VIECVTLSARASDLAVFVEDFRVRVPTAGRRGIHEDIWFVWDARGVRGFTVRSVMQVQNDRGGWTEPMDGATQETRRIRRQLDQQCSESYPIAESTRVS
jgi:hypothetical protein